MILPRILFLSVIFLCDLALSAQVIESSGSGRWNQTGTWVGGVVPAAGDSVLIIDGHDITLRSVQACEVIIIEGTSKIRINAGNSLTCDSIIFKLTAINKTFLADVRGNALWRANYFQADINSDNSSIAMLGMGRLYIDNDVNIISNAVGASVTAGVPLICRDLTLRTLTGGNGLAFAANDSLFTRDIVIDVQGTSLSANTTMTTSSQASVIAMTGSFSFPQNSGQVISSASKGILLLDANASLSDYADLQYPTIEIRTGTCSLNTDILNSQFLEDITVDLGATLFTGGNNLTIQQGNLIVNGTLSMNDGLSLIFSGSNAHTISGTGSMIIPNLIVNLVASSLTVNDSVIIREELSVLNGGLVTNDLI